MQPLPVYTAPLPALSMMANCLMSRPSSASTSSWTAPSGDLPLRSSPRPLLPKEGLTKDWVATTPTPALPQITTLPTENQCDCTAAPSSPSLDRGPGWNRWRRMVFLCHIDGLVLLSTQHHRIQGHIRRNSFQMGFGPLFIFSPSDLGYITIGPWPVSDGKCVIFEGLTGPCRRWYLSSIW